MSDKRPVHIQILGRPATGKTTIMQVIAAALSSHDIEHIILWGPDGPPSKRLQGLLPERIKAIARKAKVILAELPVPRNQHEDELNETKVRIRVNEHLEVVVEMRVAGNWMSKNFGSLALAVDRGRAMAARLAVMADTEVEDLIPRSYEVRQRSDFSINPAG